MARVRVLGSMVLCLEAVESQSLDLCSASELVDRFGLSCSVRSEVGARDLTSDPCLALPNLTRDLQDVA